MDKIKAKRNEKLKIEFNDGYNNIIEEGNIIETSINNPTSKESIIKKISKLGNSIYFINNISIENDTNIFIPLKEINNIKRLLIEKLDYERSNKKTVFEKRNFKYKKLNIKTTNNLSIFTNDEVDYRNYNKCNLIFYTENKELYKKYNNVYYRLPRIINNFTNYKNENLLINDIGAINKYKDVFKNAMELDIYIPSIKTGIEYDGINYYINPVWGTITKTKYSDETIIEDTYDDLKDDIFEYASTMEAE